MIAHARAMWGKKKFLDPELEAWHIACWSWLLRHFGGVEAVRAAPLVLPTGAFMRRLWPSSRASKTCWA
jgi:hypothetical protein